METWAEGVQLIDRWYYSDISKKRLGLLKLFMYIPILGRQAKIGHIQFV